MKLQASERGGGLGLLDASDSTQALLAADGVDSSRLTNADGRGQLVRP